MACENITDTSGICNTLVSAGSGFGGFLTAIQNPLIAFIVVFAIIGGIVVLMYAFANAVKNSMHYKMK